MKLTAKDLDAAIYRDHPVAPLEIVHLRNGNDEMVLLTAPGALVELPSMEIPQPTEPFYIGASFKKPAPPRSMWQDEIESPWLIRLYGYAFLGAIALSCVVGWWKS